MSTRFRVQPRGVSYDATLMPAGGRSLTIPNQAIDIAVSVKRFSAPTIQERLKGYYEEEGMELPNFDLLSKIERLDLLAESRERLSNSKKSANDAIDNFEKATAAAKADKAAADADKNPIPNSSNTDKK